MRITVDQEEILNDLICERLSSDPRNEELIQSFTSKRGSSLVSYFKKFGFKEDQDGTTTYYVIKTKKNDILMFFSLKCGALFEPLQDEEEVRQDFQRLLILLQAIENANSGNDMAEEATEILTKYQVGDRISAEEFNKLIFKKARNKKEFLHMLFGDREKEENDKIFRVQSTHPGVELVHFCTNDRVKELWNSYKIGHTMGETLYWKYIVPKFFEVQQIAGCEYAFLFAADLSEDGTLVNYYNVSLKFEKKLDVGTNKPFYDFCCEFMCQRVNDMKRLREGFFDNFNDDENDILA